MGGSSTNSPKHRPQDTHSGRSKGAERGPRGTNDTEAGASAANQKKQGTGRRSPQGRQGG